MSLPSIDICASPRLRVPAAGQSVEGVANLGGTIQLMRKQIGKPRTPSVLCLTWRVRVRVNPLHVEWVVCAGFWSVGHYSCTVGQWAGSSSRSRRPVHFKIAITAVSLTRRRERRNVSVPSEDTCDGLSVLWCSVRSSGAGPETRRNVTGRYNLKQARLLLMEPDDTSVFVLVTKDQFTLL